MKTILWFRRDLRLHDNPALNWACANSTSVLPVYIHAADEEQPWQPGGASRWWLHHSLQQLDRQLQQHGLKLHFFSGASEQVLSDLVQQTAAEQVAYNRLYEPHLQERDTRLETNLGNNVIIKSFASGVFFEPGSILNNQQLPYRVFTPFYKKLRPQLGDIYDNYSMTPIEPALDRLEHYTVDAAQNLDSLQLLDTNPWHEKLHRHWIPGETHALQAMDDFLEDAVGGYSSGRDIPSLDGTSRLSASLHFGEVTPQQLYLNLQPALKGSFGANAAESAEVYLKQLVWREFAQHVLWHFPHTATRPMNPRYRKNFWRSNKKAFTAWTTGQTGIPIVDAGMKQLWETGWMHNRVRMIVSSLLVKNLGISWLDGAHWFWDTLVDADLANNSLGWQWVAGCGVDAAPYYRIFNPLTQAKRFDANQVYVNTWNTDPGSNNSSQPIVDLDASRKQALERYKQHINAQE